MKYKKKFKYQIVPSLPFNFYMVNEFDKKGINMFAIDAGFTLDEINKVIESNRDKRNGVIFSDIYGIDRRVIDDYVIKNKPRIDQYAKFFDDQLGYLIASRPQINFRREAYHFTYRFSKPPTIELMNTISLIVQKNFYNTILFSISNLNYKYNLYHLHFFISNLRKANNEKEYTDGFKLTNTISTHISTYILNTNSAIDHFFSTGEIKNFSMFTIS